MEKKKKGGKAGLVAAAGAVLLLAGGVRGGLGIGGGEVLPASGNQVIEQAEDAAAKQEETATVTIEVKQDEYIVDGKPMKLGEIDSLIHQVDMYKASFVLVDNYASAKAWDDLMSLMVSHGISVVEQ